MQLTRPVAPAKPTSQSQDSETESESDAEFSTDPVSTSLKFIQENDFTIKRLKPKPGFPLAPGQSRLGPLILDAEQKCMIPAAINTYLREYQRDGVRFFWRQYKERQGGLLGDDMGLVRF